MDTKNEKTDGPKAWSNELDKLDFENDPNALERQSELLDLLITFDMGCRPARRKMCQKEEPANRSTSNAEE